MKRIKFLVIAALVIAMISSFAFADGQAGFALNQIEYNNEDTITLTVTSTATTEALGMYSANLNYNAAAFSPKSVTGKLVIASGTTYITVMDDSGAALTKDAVIGTVTFNVIDKEKAVGSEFYFDQAIIYASDWATDLFDGSDGKMTVKAATPVTPEKPVITTVAEEKGATIETDDTIYTNIFKGEYSATPVAGVGISEIGIKYHKTDVTAGDAVTLKKNVTIEGGATVNFKAAILGVAADTELVVEPYTVYDFAK